MGGGERSLIFEWRVCLLQHEDDDASGEVNAIPLLPPVTFIHKDNLKASIALSV